MEDFSLFLVATAKWRFSLYNKTKEFDKNPKKNGYFSNKNLCFSPVWKGDGAPLFNGGRALNFNLNRIAHTSVDFHFFSGLYLQIIKKKTINFLWIQT